MQFLSSSLWYGSTTLKCCKSQYPSLFPVHRSAQASPTNGQMPPPHAAASTSLTNCCHARNPRALSQTEALSQVSNFKERQTHYTTPKYFILSSRPSKVDSPQDRAKSRRWALNLTQDDSSALPKILLQVWQITPNSARLRGCLLVHVKQFASKAVQLCSSFFPRPTVFLK